MQSAASKKNCHSRHCSASSLGFKGIGPRWVVRRGGTTAAVVADPLRVCKSDPKEAG